MHFVFSSPNSLSNISPLNSPASQPRTVAASAPTLAELPAPSPICTCTSPVWKRGTWRQQQRMSWWLQQRWVCWLYQWWARCFLQRWTRRLQPSLAPSATAMQPAAHPTPPPQPQLLLGTWVLRWERPPQLDMQVSHTRTHVECHQGQCHGGYGHGDFHLTGVVGTCNNVGLAKGAYLKIKCICITSLFL